MSASDAAPLPRLGEVFFDVRGNSRSMRLSWYADTGIAGLQHLAGRQVHWHVPAADRRSGQDDGDTSARSAATARRRPAPSAAQTVPGGGRLRRAPVRRGRTARRATASASTTRPATTMTATARAGTTRTGSRKATEGGHGTDEYGAGERRAGEHGLTGGYPDRPGANRPSAGHDSAGYGRSAGYGDSAGYEYQPDFPVTAPWTLPAAMNSRPAQSAPRMATCPPLPTMTAARSLTSAGTPTSDLCRPMCGLALSHTLMTIRRPARSVATALAAPLIRPIEPGFLPSPVATRCSRTRRLAIRAVLSIGRPPIPVSQRSIPPGGTVVGGAAHRRLTVRGTRAR